MGKSSSPAPPQPGLPCQVRCADCRRILTVAPGMTEFICPNCQLPQRLPPEMMTIQSHRSNLPSPPPLHVQVHGVDQSKIQLPCANCKAILNVPHGLSRFVCPQCGIDLAVDSTKVKRRGNGF